MTSAPADTTPRQTNPRVWSPNDATLGSLVDHPGSMRAAPPLSFGLCKIKILEVNVKIKIEVGTSELAEILGVTSKTIIQWSRPPRLMEKVSHGKYRLKESLQNYVEYMRVKSEGGNLDTWCFERTEGRFADVRRRREALHGSDGESVSLESLDEAYAALDGGEEE